MCFRPSALMQDSNNSIVTGSCPTCGMSVAAEAGVTSGTCPYCGNSIPAQSPGNINPLDPSRNTKIL